MPIPGDQANQAARPVYHFTAPLNWLNDPNGLVYVDGEFHLFYQHNPFANTWAAPHWGHAASRDLISWHHLAIAMKPDDLGSIFSGSAVIDTSNTAGFGDGAIVAAFTHHQEEGVESQSIAVSTDGCMTFDKHPGNPVLAQPSGAPNFRDPRLIRWEGADGGHWAMVLAVGSAIWIYVSDDIVNWCFATAFDPDPGRDRVWECPDLFELPVTGTQERRWVMTVGVESDDLPHRYGVRYWVGEFDGTKFQQGQASPHWADDGADFYAAQTWSAAPANRKIWIGWMNNSGYALLTPTKGWRGAMSIPRELGLVDTGRGFRLTQYPVVELEQNRRPILSREDLTLNPGDNPMAELHGVALDIVALVDVEHSTAKQLRLTVRVGHDESTDIVLDIEPATLSVNRSRSGEHPIHRTYPGPRTVPVGRSDELLEVRVLVDTTSVEVFAARGLVSITEQIFPSRASDGCGLEAIGGTVRIETLEVYAVELAAPS